MSEIDRSASAAARHAATTGTVDLSEHLFHREALTLAEQSAGVGVWSIDLPTELVRGTAQFFRIMGLEPAAGQVPVQNLRELRHPEDNARVLAGFRDALDGGGDAYEIEYRIIRPDGNVRWIFGRGRVVRDERGTPIRYSGVDIDITDREAAEAELAAAKQALERLNEALELRVSERTAQLEAEAARRAEAESRLLQAQKMEAVGQLTGGLAHDFNNILQVITGNLEIATRLLGRLPLDRSGGTPGEPLEHAIASAQRASQSAKQLVLRMLAFSRMQNLAPSELHVNALIGGMSEMIRRTLGETIEVDIDCARDPWTTFADRNQLETALLNLVVNARDAMPQGGRLVVATANVHVGTRNADGLPPGQFVLLRVSDTGSGIAPEVIGKVFEPFFTTKETGKGSGLGLSMVYGFVSQSGGHVRIDSDPGCGTRVRIYLPRSAPGSAHGAAIAQVSDASDDAMLVARPGVTILLIEDNEDVRSYGVAALEQLGYRVVAAADGPSALRMIEEGRVAKIDALFSDVVLPGGMSGIALAEAIRERWPDLPALFTSGYAPGNVIDPRGMGAAGQLLPKPYRIESLAIAIRRTIDMRKAPKRAP